MATLHELRAQLLSRLSAAGIDKREAEREVDLIVEHCTGLSKASQMAYPEQVIGDDAQSQIERVINGRQKRIPLQYLLGEQWFMGMRFVVKPGVLIPRADTETLVEVAQRYLSPLAQPMFADVGTGSGAIAIALLKRLPAARAYAVDVAPTALEVAAENAQVHNVADRLELVNSAWREFSAGVLFDAIVSNPPYIAPFDLAELPPEVGVFEPKEAIAGVDEDGLGFYRDLSAAAGQQLRAGGLLAVEVGSRQANAVAQLMRDAGWTDVKTHRDLNGIDRCICGLHAVDAIEM